MIDWFEYYSAVVDQFYEATTTALTFTVPTCRALSNVFGVNSICR